jgi:ribosomal protein S18 acetylase RimI-like enzyme
MLIYRLAEGSDGRSCAEIIRDWSLETKWIGPLNEFESVVDWWRGCILNVETSWVCEENDKVVGFCVREDDNITGLYVARDARTRGIGKHLLDMAKAERDWITVWA